MTVSNRIAPISGAALLGAFVLAAPARAEEKKWPGTKAGESTSKPFWDNGEFMKQIGLAQ